MSDKAGTDNSREAACRAIIGLAGAVTLLVVAAAASLAPGVRHRTISRATVVISVVVFSALGFAATAHQLLRQKERNERLRATADALRESERRLHDFASMASDRFWEQDAELRFTAIGVETPDWAPRYIGKFRWEVADTSRAPEKWLDHKRALTDRKPFRDFRYSRIDPNGKLRHISISGMPVRDDAGRFIGYRGTGRDITAEVEAETTLRAARDRAEQAETLLHDAVDSMSEGFIIYDSNDRFVMCNETYRQMFAEGVEFLVPGMPFEDIVRGIHVKDGGSDDWRGREAEWFSRRLRHHRECKGAVEYRMGNGSWILLTDRRMKSGGIAGLRINITALKLAQAALSDSEARLERAQATANIGSWELDVATGRFIWSRQMYRMRDVTTEEFQPNLDNIAANVHPDDARKSDVGMSR